MITMTHPATMEEQPLEEQPTDASTAHAFVEAMEEETNTARDNLLAAKIQQAHFVNKDRLPEPTFIVREKVYLAMVH